MSKILITNAIPYVNARPHIGFALELVQSDTLARAHREIGNTVLYLTGADENSLKNVQAAEKAGVPISKFVETNTRIFRELNKDLNISSGDFIRTTEERHHRGAKALWETCVKSGDIYKKSYKGLYCTGCEQFYLEKDLVDGFCPEHKTKPDPIEEENWFFNLKKYEPFLKKAYAERNIRIHPKNRQSETTNFIDEGLEDFSISRSNTRAKNWGVDVPGDDSQKMYVWFDALANYITALGYGSDVVSQFDDYWQGADSILHVIGKGITKFHAIYWPAMLQSAGIFPVCGLDILVHGYVTVNGEKISKSLGNTVDPFALVKKCGTDAVRYFLLREIPASDDGDFSEEKFIQRYNSDLANGLGNLVSRVVTLAEKNTLVSLKAADHEFTSNIAATGAHLHKELTAYQFHKAIAEVWHLVALGNQYVDEQKPWAKNGEELEKILANLSLLILNIAVLLRPFLPNTTEVIFQRFGVVSDVKSIDHSLKVEVKKREPLFRRI